MLEPDRFAAARPIMLDEDFTGLGFLLESDNPAPHPLRMRITGLQAGPYSVTADDRPCAAFSLQDGQETLLDIPMVSNGQHVTIRQDQTNGEK
jgi:hypothetical protein